MEYIDAHAHLNLEEFKDDFDAIAEKTKNDNVMVINVGTGEETSRFAVELAEKYEHMKSIVGLHPIYAAPSYDEKIGQEFNPDFYRGLLKNDTNKNIVAIGECGLDYFHGNDAGKEKQEKVFRKQIELAIEYDLPLMLHIRPSDGRYDAYEDMLDILRVYKVDNPGLTGDVHFFAGTIEIAQKFLDLGFYISFTGVITFAKQYEELVKFVPMDRILSETDAPYVAPVPFRGNRNEPSHVREVVKKIAEIKELDEDVVAEMIMQNARRLFNF